MRWLEEKTPSAEDMVQEVGGGAEEVKLETIHPMCLERHLNPELARTLRVTSSPLAQETRAKMETCFAHLRKRWQYTLEPSTVTTQPKHGPAKKRIVLAEPTYSSAIEKSHAEKEWAFREQLNQKMTSLAAEQNEILKEIATQPTNQDLMKERQEIEDQILKCDIDLNNQIAVKIMDNEKMAHSNAWRSHCETTEGLKKSRGKVYSLLLGQCTQVLVDKMKQDTTWVMVSE